MQNTTHAVMAQRHEDRESLDDFPTPPWATRALMEHVIGRDKVSGMSCLEPACGRGHMARPLAEYFASVTSFDAFDYGFAPVRDFLDSDIDPGTYDWVVTNPPFRLAEDFVMRAKAVARVGVAILARTVFIESVGRFQNLFSRAPPAVVAQFTERVPMVRGRLDRRAATATGYAWLVWNHAADTRATRLVWIPPCRRELERDRDYHKAAPLR